MTDGPWSTFPAPHPVGSSPLGRWRQHLLRWTPVLLPAVVALGWWAPEGVLSRDPAAILGGLLYNAMVIGLFWLLLLLYRRETYANLRELWFFAVLLSAVVLLAHWCIALAPGRPAPIPIPFAAILITTLYNGRLAVIGAITLALLLATQGPTPDTATLFFGLAGGVASAVGMRMVRRRSQLYLTIVATAGAYALAALTLGLIEGWTLAQFDRAIVIGLLLAVGCAAVALLVLPLAEAVTRITTDIRLLELSDPTRPLLRRLATAAPGTWAHSQQMATLCEAACNAIGANGLLARVGCYYHDIGKLEHPDYFVENQRPGANPHRSLEPRESARFIREHVTRGLALAREAHLPAAVSAFIPEHHGTSRLEYFYERARQSDGTPPADPREFEYPGPRPRSKETAIAMLADSAEAALRVIDDPTPERVREAVEHLVTKRIASGQLRDAPLTLRDLDRVTQEFVRLMTGMYHQRIDYPIASGGITAEFGSGH